MSDEILAKLRSIISSRLGIDETDINVDAHFQDDFDADPLSIADLLDNIEKEFDIQFDKEQTADISTVGDILNIITDETG